ncbi:MAG TPA: family 10 glycosylhydrolase, partial [Tichowtungia sp.]|nr:family 10 glycosylhydrolase [Tichowtungia sp.]
MKTRILLFLLLPAVLFAGARPPRLPEVRAIWVTRFDYKSPLDVSSIVVNCARAGFTDIFFQVRGNATAFYPSRVEPWGFELHGKDVANTGKDPGWDPLQTAVSWAKRYNIRLHAYINVLPGWRGMKDPPRSAGQLWTAHPDWFMVDSTGAKMRPTSAWYSFLNPAHPAVRGHLMQVAAELARYDVAGLHLDYIRFPYDYKDVAREV